MTTTVTVRDLEKEFGIPTKKVRRILRQMGHYADSTHRHSYAGNSATLKEIRKRLGKWQGKTNGTGAATSTAPVPQASAAQPAAALATNGKGESTKDSPAPTSPASPQRTQLPQAHKPSRQERKAARVAAVPANRPVMPPTPLTDADRDLLRTYHVKPIGGEIAPGDCELCTTLRLTTKAVALALTVDGTTARVCTGHLESTIAYKLAKGNAHKGLSPQVALRNLRSQVATH